ncbi:MAG: hypothetical protein R2791_11060 [Saprospiraceae bacterium]
MKCAACHKLDDMRVVGPGWKDVTKRRKPEWIMNMVTNVDVMLERRRSPETASVVPYPYAQPERVHWRRPGCA